MAMQLESLDDAMPSPDSVYVYARCPRPCLLLSTLGPVLALGVPKPSIRTTAQDACSQGQIGDLSVSGLRRARD